MLLVYIMPTKRRTVGRRGRKQAGGAWFRTRSKKVVPVRAPELSVFKADDIGDDYTASYYGEFKIPYKFKDVDIETRISSLVQKHNIYPRHGLGLIYDRTLEQSFIVIHNGKHVKHRARYIIPLDNAGRPYARFLADGTDIQTMKEIVDRLIELRNSKGDVTNFNMVKKSMDVLTDRNIKRIITEIGKERGPPEPAARPKIQTMRRTRRTRQPGMFRRMFTRRRRRSSPSLSPRKRADIMAMGSPTVVDGVDLMWEGAPLGADGIPHGEGVLINNRDHSRIEGKWYHGQLLEGVEVDRMGNETNI